MKRFALPLAVVAVALAGFAAGRSWSRIVDGEARSVEAPAGGLGEAPRLELPALPDGPVRNLVLLVGDGLGLAQAEAARLRAYGAGGRLAMEQLPVAALVTTAPEGRIGPKSDASANAMATGFRTPIGRIGTPDRAPTLIEAAAAAGLATGVVSTSEVYDATPAAFYARADRRRDYAAIVSQLATAPLDLVAGGGRERFDEATLAAARARGVTVVERADALASAPLPLWALFPGKRLGEEPPHPTLDELAERALALLAEEAARRGSGFVLLLEEEGVDTAAHDQELDRMTGAVRRFDDAVSRAARFAAADGATLVVVVGDHGTGGLVVEEEPRPGTLRVVWTTKGHTAEPVALRAYGPDAAARAFAGAYDLPELGRRLRAALGLDER
jgi:alkaline phosphatase